ncbi:Dioxygenase [Vibrio aerogenes CECT 7868]|uniref:Dioxygenase n=1 Tax=Vibrio aerogenes CECT 7868 TaxID=1216006 RepID=A0A1M5ZP36_9VIBR|nr:intradiol ring-cleavage dioxygenase [Vibrio aerogenes]SHI25673.1 Dioxygenase [Vibrio aerogenes CECT 7868]
MESNKQESDTNRRKVLKSILSVAVAAVAAGCNSEGSTTAASGSSTTDSSTTDSSTTDSSTTDSDTDTGTDGSTDSSDSTDSSEVSWASGGTKNMTANFPEDSLFETAGTCAVSLTGALTEGPCYFDGDYLEDISEAQTGLPMMLCLQLIDQNCEPLSGYEIEVWHCNVDGLYSGDTTGSSDTSGFSSGFCTDNDSEALASRWFRGIQVTDSSGRVNFKSCFPGWYSSRVIHIHFRVRNNNSDEVISQFTFTDDFCTEICTTHTDYASRGAPDTLIASDTVFSSGASGYIFNTQQNDDGSLVAYKRIIIS